MARCDQSIKAAILMLVADMYEYREARIVNQMVTENKTVEMLLSSYRVYQ